MRVKSLRALWPSLFWTLLIATLWLSLIPSDRVPSAFHFWDKAQHALGFAGLAFFGLLSYSGRIKTLVLGLVLLGAGIECVQWLTGWRQGDWADWIADCVGLGVGSLIWYWVSKPTNTVETASQRWR